MGKTIHEMVESDYPELSISATISIEYSEQERHTALIDADVAIDFSDPESVVTNIRECFQLNVPIVVGTTGWNQEIAGIRKLANQEEKAIFFAPNFSLGVNLFFEMNRHLSKLMNPYPDYNVKVGEAHHIEKKDAPSGTAKRILDDIIETNSNLNDWKIGEDDETGTIPVDVERKEDVKGIHRVTYFSDDDQIVLKHQAYSRKGFARGAILAAKWLVGRKGFFEMKDMLNLS